jgi:hypothetical protein
MLNSSEPVFDEVGGCIAEQTRAGLAAMTARW